MPPSWSNPNSEKKSFQSNKYKSKQKNGDDASNDKKKPKPKTKAAKQSAEIAALKK